MFSVTVIINTLNRADSLRDTIESLRYQTYDNFEVLVVPGPCTDHTDKVLKKFDSHIRVARCNEANLSKSRNVGIAHAAGELVAFIDDDVVVDPHWLADITTLFDRPEVGAAGTPVYDYTGYGLQGTPFVCNRRGTSDMQTRPPLWAYEIPGGDYFPHIIGCNSIFRRHALTEVGGFDEEIEYYLDETELCMQLVDNGYHVRACDREPRIMHKWLASNLRSEKRVLRKPFPIVKNKYYVALRNRRNDNEVSTILEDCQRQVDELTSNARWALAEKLMSDSEFRAFNRELSEGREVGMYRGMHHDRKSGTFAERNTDDFLPFPTIKPAGRRLTFCLVSQCIPPDQPGGIGRFTLDLARGFAARGHEVHLITGTPDHNRVDLEEGVWVHRMELDSELPYASQPLPPVAKSILRRAGAVHREVLRIMSSRHVDLVSVPVWDSEGLFCLQDQRIPTVLSLQTTFKIFSDIDPSWRRSPDRPAIVALERLAVQSARNIHSISQAILDKVTRDYKLPDNGRNEAVVPLGIEDLADTYPRHDHPGRLRVLFVGRFEVRKGIDLMLEAAAELTQKYRHVDFIFVGDDTLAGPDGMTYRQAFERKYPKISASRVQFLGRLDEDDMYQEYADADIFCAPARYESFGLTYVEAMMFSTPVIGCNIGGMKEVIDHKRSGLLVEPDDQAGLVDALRTLIDDDKTRKEYTSAARKRYEQHFTSEIMVDNTLRAYADMIAQSSGMTQAEETASLLTAGSTEA